MLKNQELKKEIIKTQLPTLSISREGFFVDAEELSKRNYNSNKDSTKYLPVVDIDPDGILEEQDWQEIMQALVDDIKQHYKEWKIECEGKLLVIKHTSGKKHYVGGFQKRNWSEIEQILDQRKCIPEGDDRQLKVKIIEEFLPNLSIDPYGSYVWSDYLNMLTYSDVNDYYYSSLPAVDIDVKSVFSEEDYRDIHRVIIEDIKSRANEWRIEPEGTLTIVRHNSGKKHYKKGFEEEEWNEVEEFLKKKEKQSQEIKKNMVNWTEIHKDFTPELQQKWENLGFNYQQTKSRIEDGLTIEDYEFAHYLKQKNFNASELSANQLEKLRKKYDEQKSLTESGDQDKSVRDWENIHPDFTKSLQEKWENKGFNCRQVRDWATAWGRQFRPQDYDFFAWLVEVKSKESKKYASPQWWLNQSWKTEKMTRVEHKRYMENKTKEDLTTKKLDNKSNSNNKERNWRNISSNLTHELEEQWKKRGFTYEECKEWVDIGLGINDSGYANWLRDVKGRDAEWVLNHGNDQDLREQYREYLENRNGVKQLQKETDDKKVNLKQYVNWKEDGHPFEQFTEELTQEWIELGFSKEETKEWLVIGLKTNDADYAYWLKLQGVNLGPNPLLSEFERNQYRVDLVEWEDYYNLEKFRKRYMMNVQKWLDQLYPTKEKKEQVKQIVINCSNPHKELYGEKLDLGEYINLEQIEIDGDFLRTPLTKLKINNCPNLAWLNCSYNNLANLNFLDNLNSNKLARLSLNNNNFFAQDLNCFEKFINLKGLFIGNWNKEKNNKGIYNRFTGSLEPLKNLTKLEWLDIANTDISDGLEHLSSSIQNFYCSSKERTDSRVGKIEKELAEFGKANNHNFASLLQVWKGVNQKKLVNAQKWLDKNYFNKEQTETIDLTWLECDDKNNDELTIENYPNLKEIKKDWNNDIYGVVKVIISNCPALEKVDVTGFRDNQELKIIDCPNLKEIDCKSNDQLTKLNVQSLPKLEELYCYFCQLTDLNLINNPNLKVLNCSDNFITSLDLSNNLQLEWLNLSNNNFSKQDLSFLEHLKNLKLVELGNTNQERIEQGIYNQFFGSLKLLNRDALEKLDISNTDIEEEKWRRDNKEFLNLVDQRERMKEKVSFDYHEIASTNEQEYEISKIVESVIGNVGGKVMGGGISWRKAGRTLVNQNKENHAQEWLDKNYPWEIRDKITKLDIESFSLIKKELLEKDEYLEGDLDLSDFVNLKELNCSYNQLTNLILSNLRKLEKLICSHNQLTYLDISDLKELELLSCSNNKIHTLQFNNCPSITALYSSRNNLSEINFSSLDSEKVKVISITGNNLIGGDLSVFSRFINLEELRLGNTSFFGSLEPLKSCLKLKELYIEATNIDRGLEYLPNSLWKICCSNERGLKSKEGKICRELFFYGRNLKAWKEAHPKLMVKAWGKKVNNLYNQSPMIVATFPSSLISKEGGKTVEKYYPAEANYQEVILRDKRPFSWGNKQTKLSSPSPIKLYNIKTGQVEWTKDNSNIKSYATLSYVWGSMKDESLLEEMKVTYQRGSEEYEEELTVTKWGKKSLDKAIKACKYLGIDYLWIDQLCINQKDREEKGEEVRKMRKCYGESEVTLISINTNVKDENTDEENKKEFAVETLKKISNSQWFTRSWTFQEGFLSKQTIFMFDDCLVDGRVMAQVWVLLQQEISDDAKLNDEPQVFITPIGWTYSNKGENLSNQVNLRLSQALEAIKNRGRNNPIDGIYSILGLLPYGEKVKVKYKERGHQYTKEELEEALMEVMRTSVRAGHDSEPLSWFGPRKNESCLWWIPEVDSKGSANIYKHININCEPGSIKFTKNGLILTGYRHIIIHLVGITGFIHDEGLIFDSKIEGMAQLWVDTADGNNFSLEGSRDTLKKIKPNDILVLPNKEQWTSDKSFAILVPNESNSSCPIDIIELGKVVTPEKAENLLFIDMVNKKVIEGAENIAQYEAYIQIPPK